VWYDGIWVAGLHAEAFPRPVQPNPFLPLSGQRTAGVPAASAAGRLGEARALLGAWRACAGELILSAPVRVEDLELLPSPLLGEWQTTGACPPSIWLPIRVHREGLLESIDDPSGRAWPTELPLPGGTRSLDLQNSCPFRAYGELRLGSTELEATQPGVAADVRGQLLHVALQGLWQRLGSSRALQALTDAALERHIEQCVADAAALVLERRSLREWSRAESAQSQRDLFDDTPRPTFARECRRAVRLIHKLCALERERAPFEVVATEQEGLLEIAGSRVRLRIDRIDALAQGGRAILDYKSGRRTVADWHSQRPSHPQLLAYLAALGTDVVAVSAVHITAREVRFEGIARSPGLLPKIRGVALSAAGDPDSAWAEQREQWRVRLAELARDFVHGRAVVDPKPGACDYCQVISLCRVADRARGAELEIETLESLDD